MSEIIDIQFALEQANGSEELAKDLFTMLLNDLPVLAENLTQALISQDNQALRDHAHKLNGSTAYCGVPHLRQTAQQLEDSIKTQSADIEKNINNVIAAIEQIKDQAETILARNWSG